MVALYEIKDTDRFLDTLYPHVMGEIVIICKHLKEIPGNRKAEIVISFLKDHCIRTEWINDNDYVVKFITSNTLKTEHIEALFNGCQNNREFVNDFERCITASFARI
jgi:hypothetical protein